MRQDEKQRSKYNFLFPRPIDAKAFVKELKKNNLFKDGIDESKARARQGGGTQPQLRFELLGLVGLVFILIYQPV